MKTIYVYMMTNRSRVVLYIGLTNSLVRRVYQHQKGEIKGFTKSYKVDRPVYYETFERPRDAISRPVIVLLGVSLRIDQTHTHKLLRMRKRKSAEDKSVERELKGWRRSKKNTLVETKNPKLTDLSSMLFEPPRGPSSSSRFGMTRSRARPELEAKIPAETPTEADTNASKK